MNYLYSLVNCLAIASLLVSDVVVAVHSASCSHGSSFQVSGELAGTGKGCCCHHHCSQSQAANAQDTQPAEPEHDSDQCTICRGALLSRFAVVCEVVLPPNFEGLADWGTVTEVTVVLGHEFSSALSERGPPA